MNEIALVNYLICELGKGVFLPDCSAKQDNCLIEIFQLNFWHCSKDRGLKEFKAAKGVKRVLISTPALCMGVNFPDVRFIINLGLARSILDQHKGLEWPGGMERNPTLLFFPMVNKLDIVSKRLKTGNAKGCLCVAAHNSLDATIKPVEPLHDCCSHCTKICKCAGTACNAAVLPFEATTQGDDASATGTNAKQRDVTEDDRNKLKEALHEVLAAMSRERLSLDQFESWLFNTADRGYCQKLSTNLYC